ncbi:MAG: PQQ-binding-like beta-propeller repeat protein [Pirellulaceae bacterium]|nr:PQQ-binding-like beta-propeller repeat protein [Pirellulaceae bacterium]
MCYFAYRALRCLAPLCMMLPALATLSAAEPSKPKKVNDGFNVSSKDWPWWRGPDRNGEAALDQQPPLEWSSSKHVLWKAPIAGRGHGSVAVMGTRIFLQTADEATGAQMVLCLDRSSGNKLWSTTVHPSGGMRKNNKSTAASSTPACDGERVFVNFPNNGGLMTTALDLTGKQLWQTKICDYIEHQGYGSSPGLYQELVLVSADNKAGGAIAALNRKSGEIVWRRERPQMPNYPSPIVLHVAGKDQLLMTGCDKVSSFNPLTGETLWEVDGATTECVTSTVTDGSRIFTSGGYPKNHMSAVMADGSGKKAWENDSRLYVPSLVIRNGFLFGVLDAGIAVCWKAETGEEVWKARLGGTFSSSPVLVGDRIYATSEVGETFIYRADPTKFEQLGKCKLGDEVLSTLVICDSRIYCRAAHLVDGKREEFLYCLGE